MPKRVFKPTVVDNVPALFPPWDHRKVVDLKQLAAISGIPDSTLRDWIRRGTIPGAFQRKENGKWRFRREMLEPWWQELLSRYLAPIPGVVNFTNIELRKAMDKAMDKAQANLAKAWSDPTDPKGITYWKTYLDALTELAEDLGLK